MRALLSWHIFDGEGWRLDDATDDQPAVALLGPETAVPAPFTTAIPSWSASTPGESWIEVQLRVERQGRWSKFFRVAEWDERRESSRRRSFDPQRDQDGRLATDTLVLSGPAERLQLRVLLRGAPRPTLSALHVALSSPADRPGERPPTGRLPIRELYVPPRTQMAYPNGGRNWCSPTCVAMLLAYWHAQTGGAGLAAFAQREIVPDLVVPQVYDPAWEGTGNWAFNTAFASSAGLDAYVAQFDGLDRIGPWIAAGVPVAISAAWKEGALRNAPIPASSGHILLVTGFDQDGQVIAADPRGETESEVRRRYDPVELEAAWQNNSNGTVYLIYPPNWPVPPV